MSEGISQELIEFGPSSLEAVPLLAINKFEQVRTNYDQERLEELATSIMKEGSLGKGGSVGSADFNLVEPIGVGRHDKSSLRRYINDHGEYHQIARADRKTPSDLRPLDDGRFIILNYGHRRTLAIHSLIQAFGLDAERATVSSHVGDNIEFAKALADQLRENNHDRLPPYDEARAIALQYDDLIRKTGVAPNIKKLGLELGFSETKVRDALAFATLPRRIQAFAADGLLPFGVIRNLQPLQEAYGRLYQHRSGTEAAALIEHELVVFCNKLLNLKLSGKGDQSRHTMIQNKIKEIAGQASYQEGLFLLEPEFASRRRAESSHGLARLAFSIITHQLRLNELSPENLEQLSQSLEAARREAASRRVSLDIFDEDVG
ncbi:MAG TPA: hypothetical protein QF549_01140 [Candidatus Saccharimonadaceae bacterium]|nr:hypothetical protein [Candidatus Saccharimonadaceae bacterium]